MIEIYKHSQLLLEDRGRPANCFFRIDSAVGLQINNQLVQICTLLNPCAFDGISHSANRAERSIKLQTSDGTSFILVQTTLISRLIATTSGQTQTHVDFAVLAQVTNHMLRISDFHIVVQLDVAGSHHARTFLAEGKLSIVTAVHLYGNALEIQQNLDDVFLDTFNGTVLVHDTVDLSFSYGAARHRRQKQSTRRAAQGVPETAPERPQGHLAAR